MDKKFLRAVGIFCLFVIGLISVRLYPVKKNKVAHVPKLDDNQFPEEDPIIDYPIFCQGDRKEEFEKRKKSQTEYYRELNENKPDTQTYNVLGKAVDLYKYPELDKKSGFSVFTKKDPHQLRNYLETVSYRLTEINLFGSGYYFYSNYYLALSTNYKFTEKNARRKIDCFDNKHRFVSFGNMFGNSPKIFFSTFTAHACKLYPFIEENSDLFLVCLAKKRNKNQNKFLVLGFSYRETTDAVDLEKAVRRTDDQTYEFIPVLEENFWRNVSGKHLYTGCKGIYPNIILAQSGVYYLFTDTEVYTILPNREGFLEMKKKPEIPPGIDEFYFNIGQFCLNSRVCDDESSKTPYLFFETPLTGDPKKKGLIFDVALGKFLDIDYDSCVVSAPEEFYNETIDPFVTGSYKDLYYEMVSPTHFRVEQSSLNAGCVTNEGIINVYIKGDSVNCEIEIKGDSKC